MQWGILIGWNMARVAGLFAGVAEPKSFFIEAPVASAISPSGEWLAFSVHENSKWILYTRSIVSGQGIKRDLGGTIDQLMFLNDAQVDRTKPKR